MRRNRSSTVGVSAKVASTLSAATLRTLSILAFATIVSMVAARMARAADFYEGKTITIVVGNDAGSAYDAYARLLSRHMGRHIPGKPNIIVQDMNGAGSMIAAQHLFVVAPKDGTSFGILFPGAITEPLTGDPAKYRYDPRRFEYVGTADSGTRLCLTAKNSKIRTFEDARQNKVLLAGTSVGSSSYDYPYFFNAVAGSKFEVVTGYPGPGSLLLALERGEAEGVCVLDVSTLSSLRPDWIATGAVNFLFQAGLEPNPALVKRGIPSMWDFIPEARRPVAELFVGQQVFSRPFVAPPGVPEPQLKILRTAFMAAFADPELLEDARKSNLDVNPKDGATIGARVHKMYDSPKAVIDEMAHAIRP